jgi:hypothetical protein
MLLKNLLLQSTTLRLGTVPIGAFETRKFKVRSGSVVKQTPLYYFTWAHNVTMCYVLAVGTEALPPSATTPSHVSTSWGKQHIHRKNLLGSSAPWACYRGTLHPMRLALDDSSKLRTTSIFKKYGRIRSRFTCAPLTQFRYPFGEKRHDLCVTISLCVAIVKHWNLTTMHCVPFKDGGQHKT